MLAAVGVSLAATLVANTAMAGDLEAPRRKLAEFHGQSASPAVHSFADWVVAARDSRGMAFLIVDKVEARIFVFQPDGYLIGAAPALLGLARGDDNVPGIGTRPLASIKPSERTTPAGRFVASLGHDLGEQDVIWVDYDAAISLHRVITTNPAERRLQRLATPTPSDNRISYGCINVPAEFYDRTVRPVFANASGIVYILPESGPMRKYFPDYRRGGRG